MIKKKKETKIVILGSYNSGKTTTIENLLHKGKVTKIERGGTTIALDYGNTIIDGEKIHIFASPGQERFKFMREILSYGMNGAIVVFDNSKGITDTDINIFQNLDDNNVPYVIFANKQDLNPEKPDFEGVSRAPVIPTIAKDGEGIHDGLELLLELMGKGR
jgi:small GTP-binding protein